MVDGTTDDQQRDWLKGGDPKVALAEIKKILATWNSLAWKWEGGLFILGLASIASSLFISAFANAEFMKANDSLVLKIFGFVSALSLTAISTFNIATKANSVRRAWRHLNKAYYRYNAGVVDLKELVAAYDEGEEMIGATIDFNSARKSSR